MSEHQKSSLSQRTCLKTFLFLFVLLLLDFIDCPCQRCEAQTFFGAQFFPPHPLFPGRVLDPLKLKNPITLQPGWPVQTVGDSPAASVPHFSAAWASQIVGQVMSEGEQNLLRNGARNATWQLQPINCAHDRHSRKRRKAWYGPSRGPSLRMCKIASL